MKAIATGVIAAALIGAGWGAWHYAGPLSDARYAALTKAATSALDKGDTETAARLAIAATTGRNLLHRYTAVAEGLLLEAMMKDKPLLKVTGTKAFPTFTLTGDVVPDNAILSSDAKRLMILRNDVKPARHEIYDLSSGRVVRQFDADFSKGGPHVIDFSADLNTAILLDGETYTFQDVDTGKPVLTDLKIPAGANRWSILNGRTHVAARNFETNTVRIWDLNGPSPKVRDIPLKDLGDGDLLSAQDYATLILALDPVVDSDRGTEGRIRLAIGPSGQYSASTWDEATPQGTSRVRVRIMNIKPHVPLVADGGSKEVFAVLADDGRLLPLQTINDLRLFDLRTRRFVGAPSYELGRLDNFMARKGSDIYSIGPKHVLTTARLEPLLNAKFPSLVREACGKWPEKGALRLTPAEMKTYGLKLALDPCG